MVTQQSVNKTTEGYVFYHYGCAILQKVYRGKNNLQSHRSRKIRERFEKLKKATLLA